MFASLTNRRSGRAIAVAIAGLALGAALGLGTIAPAAAAEATQLRLTNASYGATQTITVGLNKSLIVDLPADVKEVIVSQPAVAATIMRNKRRAIIQGASVGGTNIFFLDAAGEAISVLDVSIVDSSATSSDGLALQAALARIIPGSHIKVEGFDNRVVLSGTVASGDDLQKAVAIAGQFTGDPASIANVLTVGGNQQVMLKVTVAEVNRNVLRQFGVNLSGSLTMGSVNLGFNNTQTSVANGVTGGLSVPNLTINAALRALEQRGAVHTLAEPTLTAMSGQPAEFLVGGEIPYRTTDGNGNVITLYKEYGVRLNFTPTVKSNGEILLVLDTSVSEPVNDGAVSKRSAKTTVELRAGETLSIAGIFQDSVRQQINQMPGLGNIPILGALFRSREFEHRQTELVIMVTPCLAETGRPTLPTDNTTIATDAQAIFLGRMENNYGVGQSKDGLVTGYNGSIGFVLD